MHHILILDGLHLSSIVLAMSAGKDLLSVATGHVLALFSASKRQLERTQAGSRPAAGLSVAAMIVLTTAEGPGGRLGPNEKV